ncbi:MAG TPA: MerR family transcriptional regulator [Acidimicrobiia bacterium]|nr:MerR family transcriptional regulator [Acidimicrobiia bacterium]
MTDSQSLSIGEVINLLRDDFPDVSVSKIRFLESQGLIDPGRSDSGYRQFDQTDLARLKFILQQQRDHFLPLKVIKSKLTLWERGEDLSTKISQPAAKIESKGEPLSREDLLRRSGLTPVQLDELLDAGIIRTIGEPEVFGPEAGIVATEAKRLMDQGLETRHLRTVRLSVDREAELLRQLTAPLMRANNAEARARAKDVLEMSGGSVQAMHRAMLDDELKHQIPS